MPWVTVHGHPVFIGGSDGGSGGGSASTGAPGTGTGAAPAAAEHPHKSSPAEIKKMLSAIPSGAKQSGSTLSWSKKGGYAGAKSIDTAVKKLEAQGFAKQALDHTSSPDGSHMGSKTTYVNKNGDTMTHSQSYGNTASDNRYYMSITLAKK